MKNTTKSEWYTVYGSSGSRILNVEVGKEQVYPLKLKGISICFSMLKAALCGSYVNFGVFRLYGDEALDNALNVFVKLLLSIPQTDLLVSFVNLLRRTLTSRILRIIRNYRKPTICCWSA